MSDLTNDSEVAAQVSAEIKRIGDDTQSKLRELHDSFRRDLEAARKAAAEGKEYTDATVAAHAELAVTKYEALELALKKRIEDQGDEFMTALNRRLNLAGPIGDPAAAADAVKHAVDFKMHKAAIRGELRPNDDFSANEEEAKEVADYRRAFSRSYLRKNEKQLTNEEFKALTTGSDPDGGYLVPPVISNRIITKVWETSPMRQLATVEQIGTDRMEIPLDDDEAGMGWVGEEETRPETTTPRLGTQTIMLHEQYAKPKVTQRLLEDAAVNLESWLGNKVADKFARTEASAFINGDGVKKPVGILSYPAGTGRLRIRQVVSGNATALTPDALVGLPFQLQEPFLGGSRFLMKRSALAAVALFKDQQNNYLWSEGLRGATGMTLVGYPVSFADDMPAVAAGSLSVAFGNFSEAYLIVDRLGITTLRDPYSSKPFVEFYSRRRVGGDVINFDAYILLKTSL